MGQVLQVLPRGRMTVCVAFPGGPSSSGGGAADDGEREVIVEDIPTGQHLFRASSRGPESRVWQTQNDTDQPKVFRILARHRSGEAADEEAAWVFNSDRLLFANPVTRVIGYDD